MPFGALIGSYITGYIMKITKGIRITLMIADVGAVIATIILINGPSFTMLLLGRFLSGFIVGINTSLIPIYVREFSPVEISGKTGSLQELLMKIGIFISYIIGNAFLPTSATISHDYNDNKTWKYVLGVAMIPVVIRFFIFLFKYNTEVPSILARRNELH